MGSLKEKFALFVAKRKYLRKKNEPRNYRNVIKDAVKILIVLPSSAEDILKSLDIPAYFIDAKRKVVLLSDEKLQHVAREEHSFEIITYNQESISKFGLPRKELVSKLANLEFDIVLDLTREDNLFKGVLANIPKSGMTVGFKKPKADYLYNLQIANNQNNAEISYRNFLNSIQMF